MVQFHINKNGVFVLFIICVTLLLFWWSERGSHFSPSSNVLGLQSLLAQSIIAANLGGLAIQSTMPIGRNLSFRRKDTLLSHKPELITDADLVSNLCISNKLNEFSSTILVRSEESGSPIVETYENILKLCSFSPEGSSTFGELPHRDIFLRDSQVVMWVDPLDATQELSEGLFEYVSVMICAAVQGNAVFGVVNFVFSNTTYWAWLPNDVSSNLPVLSSKRSNDAIRILISRSHGLDNLEQHIESVFAQTKVEVISAGGTGYKIFQLVNGKADLYIHPSGARRWDLCAAKVILEVSGGVITTMNSEPLTFLKNDSNEIDPKKGIFAAATKSLHDSWSEAVKKLNTILLENSL